MAIDFNNLTPEQEQSFDAMSPDEREFLRSIHTGKGHEGTRPLMRHRPEYLRVGEAMSRWHGNDYRARLERDEDAQPGTETEQAAAVDRFKAAVKCGFLLGTIRLKSGAYVQVLPETWHAPGALDALIRGKSLALQVEYATGWHDRPDTAGLVPHYDALAEVHQSDEYGVSAIVDGPTGDQPDDDGNGRTEGFVSSAEAVFPPRRWTLTAHPMFLASEIDFAHRTVQAFARNFEPAAAVKPENKPKVGRPKESGLAYQPGKLEAAAKLVIAGDPVHLKSARAFLMEVGRVAYGNDTKEALGHRARSLRNYPVMHPFIIIGKAKFGWKERNPSA